MYRVYAAHLLQTVWGKEVTGGLFSIEEDVTIFTGLTKVTSQKRVALWPYKYILFNTLFHHFWNNWYDQDWHVLEKSNWLSGAVLNRMQRKIDSIYKKETTIFQQGFLKRNKGEERQFHLMFFSWSNCFIKKWPLPPITTRETLLSEIGLAVYFMLSLEACMTRLGLVRTFYAVPTLTDNPHWASWPFHSTEDLDPFHWHLPSLPPSFQSFFFSCFTDYQISLFSFHL